MESLLDHAFRVSIFGGKDKTKQRENLAQMKSNESFNQVWESFEAEMALQRCPLVKGGVRPVSILTD